MIGVPPFTSRSLLLSNASPTVARRCDLRFGSSQCDHNPHRRAMAGLALLDPPYKQGYKTGRTFGTQLDCSLRKMDETGNGVSGCALPSGFSERDVGDFPANAIRLFSLADFFIFCLFYADCEGSRQDILLGMSSVWYINSCSSNVLPRFGCCKPGRARGRLGFFCACLRAA